MEQLKFATKKLDVIKTNIYNTIKTNTVLSSNSGLQQQQQNVNSNIYNKKPKVKKQQQQQQQQSIYDNLYEEDYTMKMNHNQVSNEYIYSQNSNNNLPYPDTFDGFTRTTNNNDNDNDYDNYQFTVKQKKITNNNNNTGNKKREKENNPYSFNQFTVNQNKSNNYDVIQLSGSNNISKNKADQPPKLHRNPIITESNNNNNNFKYQPQQQFEDLVEEEIENEDILENHQKQQQQQQQEELEDSLLDEFEDFVQIKDNNINPICVQYYIPFYQSPEMCRNETRKWLEERWFLPASMISEIKWSKQNRFYFPVYVFSVTTTTLFSATFTINDVSNTVNNQKITSNHEEILFCASNSIDSQLVDNLIKENSYSNRSTHHLPSNDELIAYTKGKNLGEKTLTIDISKEDVWKQSVHPYLMKEERKKCTKYIKDQYYVKSMDLIMKDPIIESERYFIVYLPISAETYQYGDSHYDTLTSGNKGKTIGQRPIGTGVIGQTFFGVVSKVSNLVSDSM